MKLAELRLELLGQHEALRALLSQAKRLADRALGGDPPARAALREWAARLIAELVRHMSDEETMLEPVLRDVDPWGPARAARYAADHAVQYGELRAFTASLEGNEPPEELAGRLKNLVASLLADMEREEREVLSPELLRDDLVVIDQSDG